MENGRFFVVAAEFRCGFLIYNHILAYGWRFVRHRGMDHPASACDTCPKPGQCCSDFPLSVLTRARVPTALDVMVFLAGCLYESPDQDRWFIGLPFVPLGIDEKHGHWRFRCVNLLSNGRCGDYENRPYGPCVLYEPRMDALCALYEEPKPSLLGQEVELKKVPSPEPERDYPTCQSIKDAPSCAPKP